jgi:thiol-disulfide isomerase/thioredoxin
MRKAPLIFLLLIGCAVPMPAQTATDPVAQAIAQGDLYQSKRKYELALDAYHKADKLSHHSALCQLKLAMVEWKMGDASGALGSTKNAIKSAGGDKNVALAAHLLRAKLLVQMSSKATDKKVKEAEGELREALALDPNQPVTHYSLGMVLLKQERDAEGIAELKTYLSLPNLDAKTAQEARRVIENPVRAREPFAPDFSFVAHDKQNISNQALQGKVVLMDFWGTWCPPCRESVPILKSIQKKYAGKGFQLISVSSDDDEDVWQTFVQAQHMDWTEYIDLNGEVLEAFSVESFPTYVVLDKDGVIRFRQSGLGPETQGDLEDAINKALKRPSDPALAAAAASAGTSEPDTREAAAPGESGAKSAGSEPSGGTEGGDVPFGIEAWSISGNVYKNDALSMTYEFPKGWTAATFAGLHKTNERLEASVKAAILQQHPEMGANVTVMTPKTVFYASQRGEGDGQRVIVPCIRITATPGREEGLRLETFQQLSQAMAASSGGKIILPASEFLVQDHRFLRTDVESGSGGTRIDRALVQTFSEDYILTIEILASSPDELQQIAASLQKMLFTED